MIITIDGPVNSGKSTIARMLAQKRGLFYINSGLLFRALAYVLTEICKIPLEQLVTLTHDQILKCFDLSRLEYMYQGNSESVLYDRNNISWHLKSQAIDHAASLIATNGDVREILLKLERSLAQLHDVVIDGRDTGSVVFPHADYKFFLTANPEVRALRWQRSQEKKGNRLPFDIALKEVNRRDERDKTRLTAPLIEPCDAVNIDSSDKSMDEVVKVIEGFLS
jgi:CMP/dCMP kinase